MVPLVKVSISCINVYGILTLVAFAQMHDMSIREVAIRVGGSRTGLLNASLVRGSEMFSQRSLS